MTTVVNLYGGPGCGKSTLAAGVYYHLKTLGISIELVREYVKAWAWRGHKIEKFDETYIFGKQLREESILYNKVDYIITDRPLNMSAVYDRYYESSGLLVDVCEKVRLLQVADGIKHVDLIVKRTKEYVNDGRFETEDSAKKIDELTLTMFPHLREVSTIDDVVKFINNDTLRT